MATYACYLDDAFGTRLADASNFVRMRYTRTVNGIGTLILTLPGNFNTGMIIIPDGRIEIWRKLPSGVEYLEAETVWLIKKITQKLDRTGLETLVIEADTPNCILREPGRFVNYVSGSAQADKSAAPADDQIKAYARENIGTSATGARNISSLVAIAGDLSQATSIAKKAAWRDLFATMKELADSSTQSGIYCAFDIVAPTPASLEFRTYTQQRGIDHRFPSGVNPVLLSPEMGNLGEAELTIDYRDEVTYALAGAQGNGASRQTATAEDADRQAKSPFGYREAFVSATNYSDTTGLSDEAAQAVRNGRPRTIFRGRVIDTSDTAYGVQWAWGDYLTAQFKGRLFDCRVEAVSVSVEPGKNYETIDAWLRSDDIG